MRPWLLIGGWCAVWSLAGCKEAPVPPAQASTEAVPTEILKDFVSNDSKNGVLVTKLVSKESRIYETEHYADLDDPLLYFYKEGKESSRLKAPHGRVQLDTHDVDCWGGVTVVSADSSTLTTETMHYDSKRDKISSQDPVKLEKPDSITDGIGFETDPGLVTVKIGRQTVRMKKGLMK